MRFRNPYSLRDAILIVVLAWVLAVFIAGGFLVLTAMANTLHFCGESVCPWPFDTTAENFWERAISVMVAAIPVSIAVLLAGIVYYGRVGEGGAGGGI